jgi:hypothetical protein
MFAKNPIHQMTPHKSCAIGYEIFYYGHFLYHILVAVFDIIKIVR